jgi:two-component system sporulation sensor kinase B
MLVAVILLLWLIAVAVFISDSKNESTRWFSLIVFWISAGTLQPLIHDIVIPHWIIHQNPEIINFFKGLANVSFVLALLFTPYSVLMLCVSHTDDTKWAKYKKRLAIIFLIPILVMLALFAANPKVIVDNPGRSLSENSRGWYILMAIWVTAYVVMANYFLLSSYLTAKNLRLKQEKLQLFLAIMPPFVLAVYMYNIAPFTGLFNSFQHRFIILLYILATLVFFAIKYSISAVKIIIERWQLANTMHTTFSGTAMLNHVIKSEVLKIDFCMNNIIQYSQICNPKVNELLRTIQATNTHLLALINRVQNHIKDVTLVEAPSDLLELIDQSLKMVTPQLEAKNIKVIKDYCLKTVRILCDAVHIREVLRNIALNAIEAMETGGQLHIQIYTKNKRIVLAITDNGIGISKKDLPHIMKPFFSTKNRQQNSGLGLTYSYNVMQKHGGTLEIFSVKDIGTTVFLIFPPSKILAAKLLYEQRESGLIVNSGQL